MDYRMKAINCLKDTALPVQLKLFEECGRDLSEFCLRYGESEYFFMREIEKGRVYEMGYPRCFCPEVVAGGKDASHCECSRQGILYVLESMMPDARITAETIETVLNGAEKCRFKVVIG